MQLTPSRICVPAATVVLNLLAAGCSADEPLNPSFPLTWSAAKAALREMEEHPKPFERPVIVLAGIHDPGFIAGGLARRLRRLATEESVVMHVAFIGADDFDRCRDRAIARVDEHDAGEDAEWTVEVDVVAISMGGLVARHAARPRGDGGRRLCIGRLFTISSPHRGANLAGLPTFDERQKDMRKGSAFLAGLDAVLGEAEYKLVCYARLDDVIVGAENAAPPGWRPFWVANRPLSLSHVSVPNDPRIVADIARQLRGETPFTRGPAAPLP